MEVKLGGDMMVSDPEYTHIKSPVMTVEFAKVPLKTARLASPGF